MSTFKYKSRAQKRKQENKIKRTILKRAKVSGVFFASERRSTSKFESLVLNENIVREEQETSTSLKNQTEMTTKPTQSSSDDHNSDIIFTNEGGTNRPFHFFFFFFKYYLLPYL